MDRCIFCDCELSPGSEEHVFLSAIGGRLISHRATCTNCNNAFSNSDTNKLEDDLAQDFIHLRNGLKIWSGRNLPPPVIKKAGIMSDGGEFDLVPGFIPVMRPGRLPDTKTLISGSAHSLIAKDENDAKRMIDILGKRKIAVDVRQITRVQQKAPQIRFEINFDGPKVARVISKTAIVSCCVLYGNEQSRNLVDVELRKATRYGNPNIFLFGGWDYTNIWPEITNIEVHHRTPAAQLSGFEHSVIVCDVAPHLVAYVTLFGAFKFSVVLGSKSGIPPRGLAINPRSVEPSRFIIHAKPPVEYIKKKASSFKEENDSIRNGVSSAFNNAMETWQNEAYQSSIKELTDELLGTLQNLDLDSKQWSESIEEFSTKLAVIELGEAWSEQIDLKFDEDA